MKKMLTLVLCLAILLSLAVGAVPAAKADHSEQVKLTVAYNKKGTDALPNSILDQILLEKFNIVVEWKDLEDRDFKTNMTLQMAGKDYPDIIWHSDNGTAQELSLTGHILAIDDYEDKLPDYIKIFDEGVDGGWEFIKTLIKASDGKVYSLVSKNPRDTAKCWHLRAGTMMEMGLIDSVEDLPTTVDGFVALLEQIKEKDPDSIPFMVQGWGNVWDGWDYAFNVQSSFYLDYFSGEFVPYGPATDNWRSMLITLNKLYKEGLIAEDYLTTTEDETKANTIEGMYYAEWNWAGSHTNAMNQRNSQTDPNCGWIYYLNTFAADDSQHTFDKESPYKGGILLTDKLSGERLDRVLEFFNWCSTEEGSEILSWGQEGLTYTVDENGNKSYTDLITDFDTTGAPAVALNAYTRFHQDFIPNRNVDAVIAVSGPVSYLPHFISLVAVCSMLSLLLNPGSGIVNRVLNAMGIESIYFMGSTKWYRPIYILSQIWQTFGYSAIIYMSSLAAVPQELYESASVDGASRFRQMITISLPSIMPTVIIMLILESGKLLAVGYEKTPFGDGML